MSSAVKALFSRQRQRRREEAREREFRPLSGHAGSTGPAPQEARPGKPRYKVDLATQQADCEANYFRLKKLLTGLAERDEWLFEIGSGQAGAQLAVSIIDRAPYTTTLKLSQPQGPASPSLKAPSITVCMYHDAAMAEVVAWEQHRRLQARYEYPNREMYHSDEKAQLNSFLADWLTICQAEGRQAFDLSEIGLYK